MKTRYISIITALFAGLFFVACSDGGSESNPYNDQVKRAFYPTTLTFRSETNSGNVNTESWNFTYDNQQRITGYKCVQTSKGMSGDMTSTKTGSLRYYSDHNNCMKIDADVETTYSNKTEYGEFSYTEKTNERVTFTGNLITLIETSGVRCENGSAIEIPVSSTQTFAYSGDFCTSSSYKDYEKDVTYSYNWDSKKLTKATIHSSSKDKSEINHEVHTYSYDKRNLSCDYGFNTLAFVYGHTPVVYAAMNFFGKNTPYILEHEKFSGYNESGTEHHDRPVIERDFQILDNGISNNVRYIIDSPTYSEYIYNFAVTNSTDAD